MQLYSKRNGERDIRRAAFRIRSSSTDTAVRNEFAFIHDSLRNRLKEIVKYAIKSGQYLESFLFVDNQEKGHCYIHEDTLKDLTLRELGYDLIQNLDMKDLEVKSGSFEDLKFFDLIELLIIFCKEEKRKDLVNRLNVIFKEEGDGYQIHGHMIMSKQNEGLRSLIPLIKDKTLRGKLVEYYDTRFNSSASHEFSAKVSAEIIQLLFSSPLSKGDTKDYSVELCRKVATKWTESGKVEELTVLLSETVKNAKDLFNKITNIRHTDRTTIPVETPDFYKLVSSKNINLIELVVLSLPEEYIGEQSPEQIKNSYLESYKINKGIGWVVEKKPPAVINIDDIPF